MHTVKSISFILAGDAGVVYDTYSNYRYTKLLLEGKTSIVGNSQNFIEINGKKYDAVTGAMYGSTSSGPVQKPAVDGFSRHPKDTSHLRPTLYSTKKHTVAPQKSTTLMRAAVKKPGTSFSKDIQAVANKPKTVHNKASIVPRVQAVPEHRQKLANSIHQSNLIRKFGSGAVTAPVTKLAPLEVRRAPHMDISPSIVVSAPITNKSDLLDRALESAQGHKEPYYEHKKSLRQRIAKKVGVSARAIAITTTIFAGLLLGGLYAYQNVPKLAMRVAASRAGFQATMPTYSPSGFSFNGPVQYSTGQVVVDFKSNTDDRQYKLTQQTSNWSSDSLLNNFVANEGKQYQTYQDRGRTIYIYDNNNATWVNGGVWYQIEGKSELTTDQLVRIAASL